MKMTFTVLSKSIKHGNKCVAGMKNDGTLIRIVSNDESIDGAIPNWFLKNSRYNIDVQILDDIEVDVIAPMPNETQAENYLVDINILPRVVGHRTLQDVICKLHIDSDFYIFTNNSRFLNRNEALNAGYSLKLILANNIQIKQLDSYGKPKEKADFTYNNIRYNRISVTDSDYFGYERSFTSAILFLSLAHQPFETTDGEQRYYKFIAKIYPLS